MWKKIWALLFMGLTLLAISVSASTEKPPVIPAKVLDNFDGVSDLIFAWWDSDGTIVYQRLIDRGLYRSGHRSMKIEYSKPLGYRWSFFAFQPKQDRKANNFSMYTDLIFWIYSKKPFALLVKIEDTNGNTWEEWLTVSEVNRWQKLIFDVSNARRGGVNLREIRNVLFFVEPDKTGVRGTFYLDDLFLVSRDLLVLASLPSKVETPLIKDLKEIEPGVYRLTWTDLSSKGVTLYEVLEDQSEFFSNPRQYWTNNSYLDLTEIPMGTWHYKVRAWTHLPKYFGTGSAWSRSRSLTVEPVQLAKILDNFDGVKIAIKTWWDIDGLDVYRRKVTSEVSAGGRHSLRVEYAKTSGYEWSYFAFQPQQNGEDNDFSKYSQFLFWVRADQRTTILLKLEDAGGKTWEETQSVSQPNVWQQLRFRIANAKGQMNLARVRNVLFFIQPGQGNAAGVMYLDELLLLSERPPLAIGALPAPKLDPPQKLTPMSYRLTWTDESTSGAVLYELVEDRTVTFTQPVRYWTNRNFFELTQLEAGKYYYRVRAWSQLPEAGGQASPWSNAVSHDVADIPPDIEVVDSFSASDRDNVYIVGAIVRINVVERYHATDIVKATVRITSATQNYDSNIQELVPSEDGTYYYYHWNTTGLKPSKDYMVSVTLKDAAGQVATNTSLVIELTSGLPIRITKLVTVVDVSIPITDVARPLGYTQLMFEPVTFEPSVIFRPVIRTYNTVLKHAPGVLGYGWRHNYDITLQEYSDGAVQIIWGNGESYFFIKKADGSYTNVRPVGYATLIKQSDNTFLLHTKTGVRFVFDRGGRLTIVSAPGGKEVAFNYTTTGLLDTIVGPGGKTIKFRYFQNKLESITDPNGHTIRYHYDQNDNLVEVVDAMGHKTRYEYGPGHLLTRMIDPVGGHTYFEYDDQGRLKATYNDGRRNQLTYEYDDVRSQLTVTDSLGRTTVSSFNSLGKVTDIVDAAGSRLRFDWDANENLVGFTDAAGARTSLSYDERGNPVSVASPTGKVTRFTYEGRNGYNKLTSMVDANGNTLFWEYDSRGNLTFFTDAMGQVTSYRYDSRGNLIEMVDPLGRTIGYSYDKGNQLTQISYPDGTKEVFEYDQVGNLIKMTDAKGQTIRFRYDALNRLIEKVDPDGSRTSFACDPAGRLASVTDASGTTLYIYDKLGYLIQILYPNGRSISYEYDQAGNLVKLTYPDGKMVNYSYDLANQLTKIVVDGGDTFTYVYDKHKRIALMLPNGTRTLYGYDGDSRLAWLYNIAPYDTIISSFVYQYDNVGNRVSVVTQEGEYKYSYDGKRQLTKAVYPDGRTVEYRYDSVFNRTAVIENAKEITYTVNHLNQYTKVGVTSYSYDANGNLVSKVSVDGVTRYEYDHENRLVAITHPDGTNTRYKYDALGRRIQKIHKGKVTNYIYDDLDREVLETDESGNVLAAYIWGIHIDELLMMERGGQRYYYHLDGLGNIVNITDNKGKIVESYRYDAYGKPFIIDSEGRPLRSSSIGNTYMFTGRVYDQESGLYYYRTRYYDPELGRFLTRDPLNEIGVVNRYTYVLNNPVNATDPYGLVEAPAPIDRETLDLHKEKQEAVEELRRVIRRMIMSVVNCLPRIRPIRQPKPVHCEIMLEPGDVEPTYGPETIAIRILVWLIFKIGSERIIGKVLLLMLLVALSLVVIIKRSTHPSSEEGLENKRC